MTETRSRLTDALARANQVAAHLDAIIDDLPSVRAAFSERHAASKDLDVKQMMLDIQLSHVRRARKTVNNFASLLGRLLG